MSTTTECKQPDLQWIAVYQASSWYEDHFGTGYGWWSNGPVAIYLGPSARPNTHWAVDCGCSMDAKVGERLACCFQGGGEVDCDSDRCEARSYAPIATRLPWKPLLAEFAQVESRPAILAPMRREYFADGRVTFDRVPVMEGETLRFYVNPSLLATAQRFGHVTDWGWGTLRHGPALLGYQGTNLVVVLMAEQNIPGQVPERVETLATAAMPSGAARDGA